VQKPKPLKLYADPLADYAFLTEPDPIRREEARKRLYNELFYNRERRIRQLEFEAAKLRHRLAKRSRTIQLLRQGKK
jgi:hypothetical protein